MRGGRGGTSAVPAREEGDGRVVVVEISFFSFSFFFEVGRESEKKILGKRSKKKLSLWTSALDFSVLFIFC